MMTSEGRVVSVSIMADELNYGALNEELYCSSSSFEENSDDSSIYSDTDDLGNDLVPLGIRPYQFEPVKQSETSSESEDDEARREIIGDEWFVPIFSKKV